MNLDAIRSFLHVSETGSFSVAAQRLGVMQSTISGRIRALEEELGCVLFSRGRNGAELTPVGHDFRVHAEQIIQIWDQSRHQIALPEGFKATFRFGGPVSLQDEFNLAWVLWMKKHAPHVALQLEAGTSDALIESLSARRLDAAIMYLPRQKPGLVVQELLQEKLVLVKHPELTGRWQDAFVMVQWGHAFSLDFARAFPNVPIPTISVGLGALGLQYVLALKGAAYLPLSLAGPLLADHRLEHVEDSPVFQRPVYLVYPIRKRDAELLDLALSGLRKVAGEQIKQKRR